MGRASQGCTRFAEIKQNFSERQILWSLCSVDFHIFALQLPIQTPHSIAPELQVFVSSLKISAKRAHPGSRCWGGVGEGQGMPGPGGYSLPCDLSNDACDNTRPHVDTDACENITFSNFVEGSKNSCQRRSHRFHVSCILHHPTTESVTVHLN